MSVQRDSTLVLPPQMIHTFSFQQDVDSFIDHREALDRRKKQMLFKKWSERVYSPVKVHIKLLVIVWSKSFIIIIIVMEKNSESTIILSI